MKHVSDVWELMEEISKKENADLEDTIIEVQKLERVDKIERVNFSDAHLYIGLVGQCKFINCNFTDSFIYRTKFFNCQFINCSFSSVGIEDSSFSSCRFKNSQLKKAKIRNTEFLNSKFLEIDFSNANFEDSCFLGSALLGNDFFNTSFNETRLVHTLNSNNNRNIDTINYTSGCVGFATLCPQEGSFMAYMFDPDTHVILEVLIPSEAKRVTGINGYMFCDKVEIIREEGAKSKRRGLVLKEKIESKNRWNSFIGGFRIYFDKKLMY